MGYLSNSLSDTISIVDLDEFAVLAEVPVGRDPVDLDGPHHLALDVERAVLYVALAYPPPGAALGPHAGHGESTRYGYVQALSLTDLAPVGEQRVEPSPGDIVLGPGGRLAVTHYDLLRAQRETSLSARRAALILLETPAALPARSTTVPLCIAPHGVTFSAATGRIYVACSGEDSVAVLAPDGEVLARVPVAPGGAGTPGAPQHQPYAAVLGADGRALAVSNLASNSVSVFDVADELTLRFTLPTLGAPYFAAWSDSGRKIIVPRQRPGGALLFDAETGELLTEQSYDRTDCENPHEAVVTREGLAYLVCEGDHEAPGTLVAIDPETLALRAKLPVGVFPDRMVVREP